VVETRLPALITVTEAINKVHRPSLPMMLHAVRYTPITWALADFPEIDRTRIGLKGSPTVVGKAWVPEPVRRSGQHLDGVDPAAAAAQLFNLLAERRLPEQLGWTAAQNGKGA